MLSIKNLYKSFGGIQAINNVSIDVKQGSITALIGPNGAGKTTLFNVINGSIKPDAGKITLDNIDLTVKYNLMMVPPNQIGESILQTWISPQKIKIEENEISKKADEVMDFLQLKHLSNEYAGNLSGGQKKIIRTR